MPRALKVSKPTTKRKLLAGDAVSPKLKVSRNRGMQKGANPAGVGRSWTAKKFGTRKPKKG